MTECDGTVLCWALIISDFPPPIPSLTMQRGGKKGFCFPRGSFPTQRMNQGHICFRCEQRFANQKCLEEHFCTSVGFICTCGTEFIEYTDMLEHSTTHEPGQHVLNHVSIKRKRLEKHKEKEELMKLIRRNEVVWEVPNEPSASQIQVPKISANMLQGQTQSPQVPNMLPSMSQASLPPNLGSNADMQNLFTGSGAPTVDLWTLYQPVVLLNMDRKVNKKKPYSCGKCGQCFMSKTTLIAHHSSHATDKVSGCIGCGMLLSSKKMVPRFHVCNSPTNTTKFRLITAKPPNYKLPIEGMSNMKQNVGTQMLHAAASFQIMNSGPNSKGRQMPHFSPTLQQNNQSMKTYANNNSGLNVIPAMLFRNQNMNASKTSFPRKTLNAGVSSRRGMGRGFPQPVQIRMPTNSSASSLGRPSLTSSTRGGFSCRVCHIPFETPQLLQRHKCARAKEFMAQHVRPGKPQYTPKRIAPVASPGLAQMNGAKRPVLPPSGHMKNQVVSVSLDNEQSGLPVNGKIQVDSDDDCYIVENIPEKPAEMIYQVTSSVPIKI